MYIYRNICDLVTIKKVITIYVEGWINKFVSYVHKRKCTYGKKKASLNKSKLVVIEAFPWSYRS